MSPQSYAEKLRHPNWQRKRLSILNRDEFRCTECFDKTKTLHVHHLHYSKGAEPWDYPDEWLITLCEDCHLKLQETVKSITPDIIESLKLQLKDSFIWECTRSVLNRYEDLHGLFFLLWDMPPERVMEILTKEYQLLDFEYRKQLVAKYESSDSGIQCAACGDRMKKVEKYDFIICPTCGNMHV